VRLSFICSFVPVPIILLASSLSAQCPLKTKPVDSDAPVPTIDTASVGDSYITGKVLKAGKPVTGIVQVCVNGKDGGDKLPVIANGSYSAVPLVALKNGDIITAQFESNAPGSDPSDIQTLTVVVPKLSCAGLLAKNAKSMTFKIDSNNTGEGTVPGAKDGFVVLCVDDSPLAGAIKVGTDGSFTQSGLTLKAGTYITAYSGSVAAGPFQYSSPPIPITQGPLLIGKQPPVTAFTLSPLRVIAGIDVSASASTDPAAKFLLDGAFEESLTTKPSSVFDIFWIASDIRLASIAQPGAISGTSDVATYIKPLTDSTPSQLVQSAEAYFSLEANLMPCKATKEEDGLQCSTMKRAKTLHLIAEGGVLTPLSPSQVDPTVYQVSQALYNYYVTDGGSNAALIQGVCGSTFATATPCYVAYVPEGRTRFYRSWAAGFRYRSYEQASDASGNLNQYMFPSSATITIGQNEYVSGGEMRGLVLHAGGTLTVPTTMAPSLSGVLFVYGAIDLNLNGKNQNSEQFLLQTATSTVIATNSTVAAIPVGAQNRDRYRFGLALDVTRLVALLKPKPQ
jgi:hypothetical protein